MNLAAIRHEANSIYCYPRTSDELIINLKTGQDVDQVFIYYGDPYSHGVLGSEENWEGEREEIYYRKELSEHIWWTTTIKPKYKRVKYYFELHANDEKYFLFEDGCISQEILMSPGKSMQCFVCPWMNPVDVNTTPKWVNKTVWYQIFIDRFRRGSSLHKPEYMKEWKYGPVHSYYDVYGGDLQGIIDKLDYLKELGINGLYLTPVFEAPSNHKYDTTDYRKVDPLFGDNETLKRVVSEAHARGIKVMLDGVFNHVGKEFPLWKDVVTKGKDSPYFDWFMINTWPIDFESLKDSKGGEYFTFAFHRHMPKLNTSNKEVRNYLLEICEYWLDEFHIDGIRLDVANEISHKFNKELRERLTAKNKEIFILGEIWHNAYPWLSGDEFHSVMNYPLNSSIQDFFLNETFTKKDFEHMINRVYTMYPQQVNDVLFNLLDSHDTDRLYTRLGKNMDMYIAELAILFTMPGTCCLYYGSEIAMEGGHDPDNRRVMPWDDIEAGKYDDVMGIVRDLVKMRKEELTARSRNFHFPNTIHNPRVIEYLKLEYEDVMEVIINASDEEVELDRDHIVFSHKYRKHILAPNGVLITKKVRT